MDYAFLKNRAISVAHNDILKSWADHSENFSFDDYSIIMNNLRHWLAPTVKRLETGLEILKETGDDYALDEIIHAFEHNIEDEKGDGKESSHAYLFNKSTQTYSNAVYSKDIKFCKGLPTTMLLKKSSEDLFKGDLFVMLGAALAQEIHALPQLELLLKGLEKNKSNFSKSEWDNVEYFYEIHLDGTEARHAEDLNQTIWELIDDENKNSRFLEGFDGILSHLDKFWNGITEEVKFNENTSLCAN